MALLCLVFSALSFNASAETVEQSQKYETVKTVVYQTTFHFRRGYGQWIEAADYDKADALLAWAKENDGAIEIKGWADPTGGQSESIELAFKRARTINNYLVQNGIDADRIKYEGMGLDTESAYEQARRAEVEISVTVEKPVGPSAEEIAAAKAKAEAEAAAAAAKAKAEADAAAAAAKAKAEADAAAAAAAAALAAANADEFTLRTNLAYWVGGLANIGAEWYFGDATPWSVVLNGGYSPFSSNSWDFNLGGWFVSPEVRYYLGESKQWFIGAQYLAGGFDIKVWDSLSTLGRDGNVSCLGLLGGYKFDLSKNFAMDITLGLGYSSFNYDVYDVATDAKGTNTRTVINPDVKKKVFSPIQGGINLIWKL